MARISVGGKTQPQLDEQAALEAQREINREARAYLASTDWYVARWGETGEAIPSEIAQARAEARARVVHVPEPEGDIV